VKINIENFREALDVVGDSAGQEATIGGSPRSRDHRPIQHGRDRVCQGAGADASARRASWAAQQMSSITGH